MLEQLIDSDPDDPSSWGIADRRVKPALLTLLTDQAALVDKEWGGGWVDGDIRVGFPSRRSLIEWYQRATVRTLGRIATDFPPVSCVADESLLSACVYDRDRPNAKTYRSLVETDVLYPACNGAYRALRSAATEYVTSHDSGSDDRSRSTSDRDLDPTKQSHLAMRPGFQTLDRQQHESLQSLWGGFDTEDALKDWVHALNSPTNGEIDSALLGRVLVDPTAIRYLVSDTESDRARVYREAFAVTQLLPAFVSGVRATETAELAKTTSDTPQTLRMKST